MKQLYMIGLGGKADGANIEVHDVQFMIANEIEETYEALRQHWYGSGLKLHLDGYKSIKGADGYEISCHDKPYEGPMKLFFVHIGGYQPSVFGESHTYKLIVAESVEAAKRKTIKEHYSGEQQEHIDSLVEVKTLNLLNKVASGFLHLTPSNATYDLSPDWYGYKRLDLL